MNGMTKKMTKKYYSFLILALFLMIFPAGIIFGAVLPDLESIHNPVEQKSYHEKDPLNLTRFISSETFKTTQQSDIGSFSDLLISESVSPATFEQRQSLSHIAIL